MRSEVGSGKRERGGKWGFIYIHCVRARPANENAGDYLNGAGSESASWGEKNSRIRCLHACLSRRLIYESVSFAYLPLRNDYRGFQFPLYFKKRKGWGWGLSYSQSSGNINQQKATTIFSRCDIYFFGSRPYFDSNHRYELEDPGNDGFTRERRFQAGMEIHPSIYYPLRS